MVLNCLCVAQDTDTSLDPKVRLVIRGPDWNCRDQLALAAKYILAPVLAEVDVHGAQEMRAFEH